MVTQSSHSHNHSHNHINNHNNHNNHSHSHLNHRSPFTPQDPSTLGAISPVGGGKHPSPISSDHSSSHPTDAFSPPMGDLQQLPQPLQQLPQPPPPHPFDNGLEDEELSSLISSGSGGIQGEEGGRRGTNSGSRGLPPGGGRTPSPSLSSYNTPLPYTTPYTTPYPHLHPPSSNYTHTKPSVSGGGRPGSHSGSIHSSDMGKTVVIFGRDDRQFPEGGTMQHTVQHTLSTYPINISYQPTLSTHPLNTPPQYTPSTHPLNSPY